MPKARIFTVGFSLPGDEFEYIDFDSDQTLLDADIILIEPTLGDYKLAYGEQYLGKSILSEHSSFSTKDHLNHWRSEIAAAIEAGRVVIVYLTKPKEYYRYTGERQYSGTGRSRVTSNIVTGVSSYEAIPNLTKVVAKSGSAIRIERGANFLAPYWNEFAVYSPYQVEIEGKFSHQLLKVPTGDRIVGAVLHGARGGTLLFLPPLQLDGEEFIRTDEPDEDQDEEPDEYWSSKALKLGKRLAAALVAMAQTLKQSGETTAPPSWVVDAEFRLPIETVLESQIEECAASIIELQDKKSALEQNLVDAGKLRRLLFEQGKPLEEVVLESMQLFGFQSESWTDGESQFDGIFVSPEGRCLGEVEGRDKKPINIEKFSQLERNLQEDFGRDEVTEHAKGILFGNAFRLTPLRERGGFFTDKCVSAARRIGAALVRTPDLFEAAKYLKQNPADARFAEACRTAILSSNGTVVVFPTPPEESA